MGLWLKQDDGSLVPVGGGGSGDGGIEEAPSDGKQYARQDEAWSEVVAVADGEPATMLLQYGVRTGTTNSTGAIQITFDKKYATAPAITVILDTPEVTEARLTAIYSPVSREIDGDRAQIICYKSDSSRLANTSVTARWVAVGEAADPADNNVGGSVGSGDGGGPHDHDYLPLAGGTLTGDLTVTGNAAINTADDFWSKNIGAVFCDYGMIGGTQGAYSVSMTSNGYRNTDGKWTSMGVGGQPGAVQMSLLPTGIFEVRTKGSYPTGSASNPPLRLSIDDVKTKVLGDLQVDGSATVGGKAVSVDGHGHSGYSPTNHGHSGYSPTNHGHSNYLLLSGGTMTGQITFGGGKGATFYGNGGIDVGTINMGLASNGTAALVVRSHSPAVELQANGTQRAVYASNTGFFAPGVYAATVDSGAHVRLTNANGALKRSTNSRVHLTQIEPARRSAINSVLDLEPVWYRSNCKDDNPDRSHYGFISEDAAEVDARFVNYVEAEDGTLEPGDVNYGAITALLVSVVKEQRDQIAELSSRIEELGAS